MKQLLNSIGMAFFAIITTITTTSCSNVGGTRISNSATRGGGKVSYRTEYKTVKEEVPPSATVGLEVFAGQPAEPTLAAKANKVTWGSTHGGQAYNEMRPKAYARLETPSAETLVLLDTSTGFMWKAGCHNRLVPAQSRTVERQVAVQVPVPVQDEEGAGSVQVDNSVHVETGLNNLFAGATALAGQVLERGLVQGGGCYQPQPRYRQQANCFLPRVQRPPQQRIPNCPRCGGFHPGRPCQVVQQQGGRIVYRVHNSTETNNLNVNNAPRTYQPPQRYNSGSYYQSRSQGRPFGNGSNNAGFARGNPGLSYF